MGLTVKVNGSNLGLVHKGSGHSAKCTAPDVCKTPSPGGPVPIPYPVIMSQSSELTKGTTTVKADSGQMIAIKDCEYATCNGDEAGTAGGVVSSTNMKEAKFILFSFDVKLDGKNACRLHDKMTMNHQNTICMLGTDPTECETEKYDLGMDCENPKKGDLKPDKCQRKELCAMIDAFNNIPKEDIKVVRPSPSATISKANSSKYFSTTQAYEAHVVEYNKYQQSLTDYRDEFAKDAKADPFDEDKFQKRHFYDKCRYEQWRDGKPPEPGVPGRSPTPPARGPLGVNPDHVHDAGLGGPVGDIAGMKNVNYKINSSLGRRLGSAAERGDYKPGMKVEASKCCPAPD
jgi:Domain of unknown function (DUF4150)